MPGATRRERLREATDAEIRQHARTLLVQQGRHAVALRAIARELGMTVGGLYRYYPSREELLRKVCDDIAVDLTAALRQALEDAPTGPEGRLSNVFVVCRAFRTWALAHPQEFALVFASREEETGGCRIDELADQNLIGNAPVEDQLGMVFLEVVNHLLIESDVRAPEPDEIPEALRVELEERQGVLRVAFSMANVEVADELLSPSMLYFLLRWWSRLYGHVALEVFGNFPFRVSNAELLFESMLGELARDIAGTTSAKS